MKNKNIVLFLLLVAVTYSQMPQDTTWETRTLYLERGVGLRKQLEIGRLPKIVRGNNDYSDLRDMFGLDYQLEYGDTAGTILHVSCNRPGCITDHNIAVGESEKMVIRRFGPPQDVKEFEDNEAALYVYDGVAFKIERGQVSTIYIIPSRR